jgi:hypothetical protein
LYTLATTIGLNTEDDSPDWTTFLQTTIEPMRITISRPYGGICPSRDEAPPEEDLVFPIGRSQMSMREQGKLPATATVFPKSIPEDGEDELDTIMSAILE